MTLSSAQSRARRPFTPFSILSFGILLTVFAFLFSMPRLCFFRYLLNTRISNRKSNIIACRDLLERHEIFHFFVDVSGADVVCIAFDDFFCYVRKHVPPIPRQSVNKKLFTISCNYVVHIFTLSTVVPQSFFDRHFLTRFCMQCRSHTDHSLQFVKCDSFVAPVIKVTCKNIN